MTLLKTPLLIILLTLLSFNAQAALSDHFVTTWKTDNPGSSNDTSITISLNSSNYWYSSYNYDVDWNNDGVFDEFGITGHVTHDFGVVGEKTIRIKGVFPAIRVRGDSTKIISIDQWGTNRWLSMSSSFSGAVNLINNATDSPNLSVCRSLNSMFLGASLIGGESESANWQWYTSSVTDMRAMFSNASSFNRPIHNWDTSNVEDMANMFSHASSFNQPISNWDTSSVEMMQDMFSQAISFNQDIGDWNTSSVVLMWQMFDGASSFDQDIGGWNIEEVVDFSFMFNSAKLSAANYDALLIGWNTQRSIINNNFGAGDSIYCSDAAQIAHDNFTSVLNWDITDGGVCENTLNILTKFIVFDENSLNPFQIEVSDPDYDTPNFVFTGGEDMGLFSLDVISGEISFTNAPDFENPLDANGDNVYLVEVTVADDGSAIEMDTQLIKIYVNNINENLFSEHFVTTWYSNLITIRTNSEYTYNYNVDWDNDGIFDVFNKTGTTSHVYNGYEEHTIRISGDFPQLYLWATDELSSVDQWGSNPWESMENMFFGALYLIIKAQDTPNLFKVKSLRNMFALAVSIGNTSEFENWNWQTPTVTDMEGMFKSAYTFNQPIGNWNTGNVTTMERMFSGVTSFNQSIENWDTSNVENMGFMFDRARSFNQNIGNWDTKNVNNMFSMFSEATSFDQDLGGWNVENVDSFESMFENSHLSEANYDALLVGWNSQNLKPNLEFSAGTSMYCSQAAQASHDNMTSIFNWTITDGGVCPPKLEIVSDANISVNENHTTIIKVLTTDPDFDTPIFSVTGGADDLLFSIDSTSGVLSFIDPPDFETPLSVNNNNTYEVEVSAMDNGIPQEFASQLITVNVNDLIETSPIDLVVTATADINIVNLGDTIVYTVVVSNIGSEDAVNASIYDLLPAEITGTTWTCVATGAATCTASGTGEIADIVSIPNDGSTLTYTVSATVSNNEYLQSNYQVFADSNEPQYDIDLSNNAIEVVLINSLIFKDGFD